MTYVEFRFRDKATNKYTYFKGGLKHQEQDIWDPLEIRVEQVKSECWQFAG